MGQSPVRVSNRGNMDEDADRNNDEGDRREELIEEIFEENVVAEDDREELASILQFLIRSGQIHIISASAENDDDDESFAIAAPPKSKIPPDTARLDQSTVKLQIEADSGLSANKYGRKRPNSVTSMLFQREMGMYGHNKFSMGDRCKISNNLLPSHMDIVDSYENKIFCGLFSKDGNVYLTGCQDRILRVYDSRRDGIFQKKKEIHALDVGWSIVDTAFSPDGRHVAYSSWSENIHMVNIHEHSDVHETYLLGPEERRFCIFSLAFSEDNREILGGASDGCMYVYDLERNQRSLKICGHEDDVNAVAFADETTQIIYSAGDDGLCKVWDRRTLNESDPMPVGVLAGHVDGIVFIDTKGDGRHLITNSKDQTIKLWDIRVFSPEVGLDNTRKAVLSQQWDYRWQKVPKRVCTVKDNLEGDTSVMTYRGHTVLQTLLRSRFSPQHTTGQRYIYTGCAAGRVVIYDVLTGKIAKVLSGHNACVRDVSWHPYRNEILSASWDNKVGRWTYREDIDDFKKNKNKYPTKLRRSERIAQQKLRFNTGEGSSSGSR